MNCTFKVEGNRFDFRVGAFIIKENQVLFIKNDKVDYYYSVGGRVQLHETMEEAIKREIKEETSLDLVKQELAVVHENFFVSDDGDEQYHQIGMYYHVELPDEELICESVDESGNIETLCWLPIDELEKYDIRPSFLKNATYYRMSRGQVQHIVEKNE